MNSIVLFGICTVLLLTSQTGLSQLTTTESYQQPDEIEALKKSVFVLHLKTSALQHALSDTKEEIFNTKWDLLRTKQKNGELEDEITAQGQRLSELENKVRTEVSHREALEERLQDEISKREALEQKINDSLSDESDKTTLDCNDSDDEATVRYAGLHRNTYREVQRIQVNTFSSRRLIKHGCELWLPTKYTLDVYSRDLQLIRNVTLENVMRPESVVGTETGHLMVADNGGTFYVGAGLKLLHANGSYVETLKNGTFYDVLTYQGRVYTFSYTDGSYRVFIYAANEFGDMEEIDNIPIKHQGQRLGVDNDALYVTDGINTDLYHYNMTGNLLSKSGHFGKDERGNQAGVFDGPLLCNVDKYGNVLIADQYNRRMQVYDAGVWSVVSLDQNVQWVLDTVVSGDGNTLWVLEWRAGRQLVKYTKN